MTPIAPEITHGSQPEALLAAHSVDEFVSSVPNIEEARHFYTSLGLEVRNLDGGLALHTYGHSHCRARVLPSTISGATKCILWLTLGIHEMDMQRFELHFAEREIARIEPPSEADAGGIWIEGPDGLALQLRVTENTSPSLPAPREFTLENRNVGRSSSRGKLPAVRPLYLSHILLFSADVDAATRFYEEIAGLRLSDKSGALIAFLHSPHGSDHHLIALAKSDGVVLHHSSWCVSSINSVGLGAQQMVEAGYVQGRGVGRHGLGSNYFRYVRDPWGSYAEYSYDIDLIEAGADWPSADHPGEDSLYAWGPSLPEGFIVNYKLPTLSASDVRELP